MPGKLDQDRVALILVEAMFFGDKRAAEKNHVSQKTIQRYRKSLDTDKDLSLIVSEKKERFEGDWAARIPKTLINCLDFLDRAAQQANPADHETIHAIAGAAKLMAEIGLTKDIIDARLGRLDLPARTEDNEMDTRAIPAQTYTSD